MIYNDDDSLTFVNQDKTLSRFLLPSLLKENPDLDG